MCVCAKSLQSCPTLCNPIDGSPPGSPVPGIPQEKTLEWVAISFSNAWKWKVKVKSLSRVLLLVTPRTAAYQAPLSMGFSREEYLSGVPLPSPLTCLTRHIWTRAQILIFSDLHTWFWWAPGWSESAGSQFWLSLELHKELRKKKRKKTVPRPTNKDSDSIFFSLEPTE